MQTALTQNTATVRNQETDAYYAGRNSVWQGFGPTCPFDHPTLRASWARGRRHALAEERLSDDTEWDGE
jgi:ribosome modulation factor